MAEYGSYKDTLERCEKAARALEHGAALEPVEVMAARLRGKAQGVRLAVSFLVEAHQSGHPDWAFALHQSDDDLTGVVRQLDLTAGAGVAHFEFITEAVPSSCANGDCDHEDECPEVLLPVCGGCLDALGGDDYDGPLPVWPCKHRRPR